jgi:tripartite-type tricarboxylate transporter receptor subunit TctC
MYAPRNTPAPVVAALNTAVNAGLEDAHVKARIAEGGGLPMPMTPAQFGRFTLDDIEKWRKVVEFAGVSAD